MVLTQSELANFLVDTDDENCPRSELHLAAFRGEVEVVREMLQKDENQELVNKRIRPFLASPLRLAVTGTALLPSSRFINCFISFLYNLTNNYPIQTAPSRDAQTLVYESRSEFFTPKSKLTRYESTSKMQCITTSSKIANRFFSGEFGDSRPTRNVRREHRALRRQSPNSALRRSR